MGRTARYRRRRFQALRLHRSSRSSRHAAAAAGEEEGAVKETIVENKVEDLKDYMEKVAALVHEYVPPNPQKIQAVQAAGNMSTQPSGTGAVLSLKDYNKSGDVLAIGFDPAAKKFLSYKVNSYVEKPKEDDVTLAVTFTGLPDGTNYPGQVVLDAPAKKIQVKITNSDYKKKS